MHACASVRLRPCLQTGDGEGMNEMNASMDFLRLFLSGFRSGSCRTLHANAIATVTPPNGGTHARRVPHRTGRP